MPTKRDVPPPESQNLPSAKPSYGCKVEAGIIMNVPPRTVPMVGKKFPKLLHLEDTTVSFPLLDPAYTGGRVTIYLLTVYRLPEYHFHNTERLIDRCRCVLRKKPRSQVEHVGMGDLRQPFVRKGIAQNVFLEPLMLNLGVPPGDTLALLTQSAYVWATIPDKEGCGVLTK